MPQITDPAILQELNGQPSAQAGAFPGIVQGRPKPPSAPTPKDPRDIFEDERDFNRDVSQDLFSNEQGLRKEFYSLPAVKEFQVAGRTYANSLQAADDASGDQSLIVAYAKMLDPGSVVREGEAAAVAGADSTIGRAVAAFSKEFGLGNGGQLSPQIRQKIRREMRTLADNYGKAYDSERAQFEELARSYNFEPNRVVGPHLLDPYRETIDQYWAEITPDEERPMAPISESEGEGLTASVTYEGPNNYSPEAEAIAARRSQGQADNFGAVGSLIDSAATLGKQGITLGLADEAAGVGGAISALFTGKDAVEGYYNNRDAERLRVEQARGRLGIAGTALELAGGGGAVRGLGGSVMRAGRALGAGNVTRSGVQQQLTREATRTGVGLGALGGFGYGEGAGGSAVNALAGAALGGVAGNVGQRFGNALSNRAAAAPLDPARARQVADAGRAEGVTVNRAMIDPSVENRFSGVEATGSGPRLNRAMNEISGEVEGRLTTMGGDRSPGAETVGSAMQGGASRTYAQGGQRAGRLYERADQAAGGKMVQPQEALKEIDNQIAELQASGGNTNRGLIGYLEDLKTDLAGGMTIRGLRDQRTAMRGQINERNLGMTDAERRVSLVMDAASQDIEAGLRGNTQALNLYRRADGIWRERSEFRQQILRDLRGPENQPLSGEKAAAKVGSWMRDDAGRFNRMWKSLDGEEQAELRGYVAQSLGRDRKGEFSPAMFLNQTGGRTGRVASDRALRTIFGDEGFQSIKNLRTISEELNRLDAMRNRSNTGRVNNYRSWMVDALFGGGGVGAGVGLLSGSGMAGAAAAAGTAATVGGINAARNTLTTRMLLSPRITKWIAQAPSTQSPQAINRHFGRLGDIAKAEPALAGDIEALRKAIIGAANDNAGGMASSAAEEPQD